MKEMTVNNASATMSRKEREREQHRREILKAAERIFGRKGYHATTIEEIAKEAEFAVGTLYNLFKGKDDLYMNVIETFAQDFFGKFNAKVIGAKDPEEAISSLIELRLTHFDEHREFIRIAFEVSPRLRIEPVPALPPRVVEMYDQYFESVVKLFEDGIARGIFDEADPLYMTLCLEGIINAFIAYWSKHEPSEPLDVRILKMKREFLERIKIHLNRTP